jgi:hypothetical protein
MMQGLIDMHVDTCNQCGIPFGLPMHYYNSRQTDKKTFYCPNGHPQAFIRSKLDVALEEKAAAITQMQARINEAQHAQAVAEKALESEKRKLRKVEKRIAAGVCSCCSRSFENLQKHMRTKHPTYGLPAGKVKQIEGGAELERTA